MDVLQTYFINTLSWWQWALLAAVPPAIIALYFLKLRRRPIEVPSTYLWRRTIEDLHVNSLWQRLRRNLLLLLQLLLLLLLILAALRPGWRSTALTGGRYIFLVDTSASMTAADVAPTRLDEAKRRVLALIEQMRSGDAAMLVSFSDRAQIEQTFTDDRLLLRRKLEQIQPTRRTSDLSEALRVAAGLANTEIYVEPDPTQPEASGPQSSATLYILSDGGFPPVTDFSLGNLHPVYLPIGDDAVENVAVAALAAQRQPERPGRIEVYARLANHGPRERSVVATLYRDDALADAAEVALPPRGEEGVGFVLEDMEQGVLRLEIDADDPFPLDNVAYAVVNPPRQARVLLVTPGNEFLEWGLSTARALRLAAVSVADPAILAAPEHQRQAAAGAFDLVIYDQCAPPQLPEANTLFIGRLPPGDGWRAEAPLGAPQVIDVERGHPLMRYLDFGDVRIAEALPLAPPPGGTVLVESDGGPIAAIAPRLGFEDAVLGFEILGTDAEGRRYVNTDWVRRRSFPLFLDNLLEYFGRGGIEGLETVLPGKPITLHTPSPAETIRVVSPSGRVRELSRQGQAAFTFLETDEPGVYEVREGDSPQTAMRFAVNLFDPNESDLAPRETIYSGYTEIAAESSARTPVRRETWKYLLLAGLAVLVAEWYLFNRRVAL